MNNPLNSFLIENFWNYGNPIFCRACYKTLILIFWKPIYRVNSHVGGIRYCVRWRVVTVKTISFNLSYSDLILKFNQEWPWRSFIRNFTAELTLRYLFCLTKGISAIILNFRSINAHFNQKKKFLVINQKNKLLALFYKIYKIESLQYFTFIIIHKHKQFMFKHSFELWSSFFARNRSRTLIFFEQQKEYVT